MTPDPDDIHQQLILHLNSGVAVGAGWPSGLGR